jgi:hypothetical protein
LILLVQTLAPAALIEKTAVIDEIKELIEWLADTKLAQNLQLN